MEQNNSSPELKERVRLTKRSFFAYRNGILVDVLRKAGSPYKMIFGLNIPQIVEIATATGRDHELALALFADRTTRESQLLAPMIADRDAVDRDCALRLLKEAPDSEAVDILCHRLLRHLPFASEIVPDDSLPPYSALRLAANLTASAPDTARAVADRYPGHPLAATIAATLI